MKINVKTIKIIILLSFLVCILCCALLFLNYIKMTELERQLIAAIVKDTEWPIEDVPMIPIEGVEVNKIMDGYMYASVDKGVSYSDLRKYLVVLYDAGFNEFTFNSKNPNYMIETNVGTDINYINWSANSQKYSIFVTWAQEGAVDYFGDVFNYNFDVILTTKNNLITDKLENDNSGEVFEDVASGEQNLSGDIENE